MADKQPKKVEKEICSICKKKTLSWTHVRTIDWHVTLCPNCLMWSMDKDAEIARQWIRKGINIQARNGVEVTKGGAYE